MLPSPMLQTPKLSQTIYLNPKSGLNHGLS